MSKKKIVTACIQTRAHDRDAFPARFPELLALIERAATQAALVVAPEGMVPAYVIGEKPVDPEQIAQAQEAIGAIARRHGATIVYGSARVDNGQVFNSAIVMGPDGTPLGHADKRFLWHFDRRWFTPGTTLEPIATPLGPLGLLICADGRIPTIAATLVDRGAEILVMSTAWVTSGRNPEDLENLQADLFITVRARENGVPFIAANKVGVEAHSVAYCGKSAIIDCQGTFLARASEREEEILLSEIEMRAPRRPSLTKTLEVPANPKVGGPSQARIALTCSNDPVEVRSLAGFARVSDADLLIARTRLDEPGEPLVLDIGGLAPEDARIAHIAGMRIGLIGSQVLCNPHGLVAARLAGVDLFVWQGISNDFVGTLAYARARAAELRAFIVTVLPERGMACDPEGAIVCGTFGDYRAAAFTYDRSRCEQTMLAPHTDILEGLRNSVIPGGPHACVRSRC